MIKKKLKDLRLGKNSPWFTFIKQYLISENFAKIDVLAKFITNRTKKLKDELRELFKQNLCMDKFNNGSFFENGKMFRYEEIKTKLGELKEAYETQINFFYHKDTVDVFERILPKVVKEMVNSIKNTRHLKKLLKKYKDTETSTIRNIYHVELFKDIKFELCAFVEKWISYIDNIRYKASEPYCIVNLVKLGERLFYSPVIPNFVRLGGAETRDGSQGVGIYTIHLPMVEPQLLNTDAIGELETKNVRVFINNYIEQIQRIVLLPVEEALTGLYSRYWESTLKLERTGNSYQCVYVPQFRILQPDFNSKFEKKFEPGTVRKLNIESYIEDGKIQFVKHKRLTKDLLLRLQPFFLKRMPNETPTSVETSLRFRNTKVWVLKWVSRTGLLKSCETNDDNIEEDDDDDYYYDDDDYYYDDDDDDIEDDDDDEQPAPKAADECDCYLSVCAWREIKIKRDPIDKKGGELKKTAEVLIIASDFNFQKGKHIKGLATYLLNKLKADYEIYLWSDTSPNTIAFYKYVGFESVNNNTNTYKKLKKVMLSYPESQGLPMMKHVKPNVSGPVSKRNNYYELGELNLNPKPESKVRRVNESDSLIDIATLISGRELDLNSNSTQIILKENSDADIPIEPELTQSSTFVPGVLPLGEIRNKMRSFGKVKHFIMDGGGIRPSRPVSTFTPLKINPSPLQRNRMEFSGESKTFTLGGGGLQDGDGDILMKNT